MSLSSRDVQTSLHGNINTVPQLPNDFSKVEGLGRRQEKQSYVMELDAIDLEEDVQDVLFTQYSIDSVYLNYVASQYRVRQYTHFLAILKREEEAWAQRVEKAKDLMPNYQPPLQPLISSL
ncbi:hypothetical protein EDD22DRAFT_960060 [Suillus occidentalis]|nr:hypothetical protein EDD22DRAFT_960060 [Suillus occidentalis]